MQRQFVPGILIDSPNAQCKENAYWVDCQDQALRVMVSVPDITVAADVVNTLQDHSRRYLIHRKISRSIGNQLIAQNLSFAYERQTPALTVVTRFAPTGAFIDAHIMRTILAVKRELPNNCADTDEQTQAWMKAVGDIIMKNKDFTEAERILSRRTSNMVVESITMLARYGAAQIARAKSMPMLISRATVPLVLDYQIDKTLRTHLFDKRNHAPQKMCAEITMRNNIKHIGFTAPLRKIDHFVNLLRLAGTMNHVDNPLTTEDVFRLAAQHNFAHKWGANRDAYSFGPLNPAYAVAEDDACNKLSQFAQAETPDPATIMYLALYFANMPLSAKLYNRLAPQARKRQKTPLAILDDIAQKRFLKQMQAASSAPSRARPS